MPYFVDVLIYDRLSNFDLKAHLVEVHIMGSSITP